MSYRCYVKSVRDRGWGFLACAQFPKGVFFHATSLEPGLVFGPELQQMNVEFEVEQTDRGPAARNVRKA